MCFTSTPLTWMSFFSSWGCWKCCLSMFTFSRSILLFSPKMIFWILLKEPKYLVELFFSCKWITNSKSSISGTYNSKVSLVLILPLIKVLWFRPIKCMEVVLNKSESRPEIINVRVLLASRLYPMLNLTFQCLSLVLDFFFISFHVSSVSSRCHKLSWPCYMLCFKFTLALILSV